MLGLIDFILNLAGILLWLTWRSVRFDPLVKTAPASLVGTLRRAEPRRFNRWHFLIALAALLLLRPIIYYQIGSAVDWTPNLHLAGIEIAIPFRSDHQGLIFLFSALSFGVALGIFYLSLLLFSLVNRRSGEDDVLQRLVRVHLGVIDRWPWPIKAALPLLISAAAWFCVSFLLARLKLVPPVLSTSHRVEQALVIGLGTYLVWKYLIGVVLGLYLIHSYIYLGNQPFWGFIALTGRNLLTPLRRLPLCLGKVDFAPIIAVALVFLAAYGVGSGLTALYRRLPL